MFKLIPFDSTVDYYIFLEGGGGGGGWSEWNRWHTNFGVELRMRWKRYPKKRDGSEVNFASPDFARKIFAPSRLSTRGYPRIADLAARMKGLGTHFNFAAEAL